MIQQSDDKQKAVESLFNILKKYEEYKKRIPDDLKQANFNQENNKFVILVGGTGVGKTTLFNFLRGVEMIVEEQGFGDPIIKVNGQNDIDQCQIGNGLNSETKDAIHKIVELQDGKRIILVDTPGFYSTNTKELPNYEQQWLDSLKMNKYLKYCKNNCVFLFIIDGNSLFIRENQNNLEGYFNLLKNLSGINNEQQLKQMVRIVINKVNSNSKNDDVKLKENCLTRIQNEILDNEVPKTKYVLSQYLQILEQDFIIIRKPVTESFSTDQQRQQCLQFINQIQGKPFFPFITFQNSELLEATLKVIQLKCYQQEIENLKDFLKLITDQMVTISNQIILTDNWMEISLIQIGNWFKNSISKTQVFTSNRILEHNPDPNSCQSMISTLYTVQICFTEIAQLLSSQQFNGLRKIPKRIEELLVIIDQRCSKKYNNFEKFKHCFKVLLKFDQSESRSDEKQFVNHIRQILCIEQITTIFKNSILKLLDFTNKLNKSLYGGDYNQLEMQNIYKKKVNLTQANVEDFIKTIQNTYSYFENILFQKEYYCLDTKACGEKNTWKKFLELKAEYVNNLVLINLQNLYKDNFNENSQQFSKIDGEFQKMIQDIVKLKRKLKQMKNKNVDDLEKLIFYKLALGNHQQNFQILQKLSELPIVDNDVDAEIINIQFAKEITNDRIEVLKGQICKAKKVVTVQNARLWQ